MPQWPPLTAEESERRLRKLNEELKNLTSEEEPDGIEHMTDAQFDAFERRRRAADMRSRIEQTRLSTEEREAKKRRKRERKEGSAEQGDEGDPTPWAAALALLRRAYPPQQQQPLRHQRTIGGCCLVSR